MAGPPPLLREDRLTLEQLGRKAREFDQLSTENGTWPATDFVRWLRDQYRASGEAGSNAGSNGDGRTGRREPRRLIPSTKPATDGR